MGKSPFTMPGSGFYGKGNQSVAPGKYTQSPTKQTEEELKTLRHGTGTDWEHTHASKPAHSGSAEAHGKKPAAPTTYASPVKGRFIDALKKGNFKGAGNVLKREVKGIGAGIKEALTDNYSTSSKSRDIKAAYDYAKRT